MDAREAIISHISGVQSDQEITRSFETDNKRDVITDIGKVDEKNKLEKLVNDSGTTRALEMDNKHDQQIRDIVKLVRDRGLTRTLEIDNGHVDLISDLHFIKKMKFEDEKLDNLGITCALETDTCENIISDMNVQYKLEDEKLVSNCEIICALEIGDTHEEKINDISVIKLDKLQDQTFVSEKVQDEKVVNDLWINNVIKVKLQDGKLVSEEVQDEKLVNDLMTTRAVEMNTCIKQYKLPDEKLVSDRGIICDLGTDKTHEEQISDIKVEKFQHEKLLTELGNTLILEGDNTHENLISEMSATKENKIQDGSSINSLEVDIIRKDSITEASATKQIRFENEKLVQDQGITYNLISMVTIEYWNYVECIGSYRLFPISTYTEEFQKILKMFIETSPSSKIQEIKRVQNPYLYTLFNLKKLQLSSEKGCKILTLFHGTKECNIDSICKNNFDWRKVGTSGYLGCKFGKGVAFSPKASYAADYPRKCSEKPRIMFVAKVLEGKRCAGSIGLEIPPDDCDTTTGNNGDVVVKFCDNEYYPEYIISYV